MVSDRAASERAFEVMCTILSSTSSSNHTCSRTIGGFDETPKSSTRSSVLISAGTDTRGGGRDLIVGGGGGG